MLKRWSTLIDMLRSRAQSHPDQTAFTFVASEEMGDIPISFGDLDRQARSIAARLQSLKLDGDRILLLYPPGLEFISAFFGCLYAGAVAVPLPFINVVRPGRWADKLRSIIDNSRPRACLTTERSSVKLENLLNQAPDLSSINWLVTDSLGRNVAEEWKPPAASGETLGYLQYTSGSTSNPKGIMITHNNALHTTEDFYLGLQQAPDTILLSWLPHFHDLGLVYGVLMPLYAGIPGYLMPPALFVQHPLKWLSSISRYRVTHTAAPNFAYDLCVARFKPEKCDDLDLSSWRVAVNGAEPVRSATIKRFSDTFAPYRLQQNIFRPAYGLAEATLVVSVAQEAKPVAVCSVRAEHLEKNRIVEVIDAGADGANSGIRELVGCGYKVHSINVAIVHPALLTRCLPGEVGEIWVAGPGVASGYWDREQETEMIFRAFIADTGEGPFLRTGDLGFLKGEELFVTGRIKDLIIIDGSNHYPQDIEQTVERSHPAIRAGCCAAFSIDVDAEERLIIVAEVNRHFIFQLSHQAKTPDTNSSGHLALTTEVTKHIHQAVAEAHDMNIYEVVLLRQGSVPKTSSGKIQRHACRAGYLAGTLDSVQ
jgi:acyl-CoA synthetase (AMP-forming)/AMP-acid ligase II